MEIKIEKMNIEHLEKIKEILETDFDDFWNYNVFKQELSNENSRYIIAKSNDEIVGFAGYMLILDEADITNVVVKKSYRNKHIGTMLLENLINEICENEKIETITLEVNENNSYAIKLYENFGFIHLGIRKNYYEDHTNAVIMTKFLET